MTNKIKIPYFSDHTSEEVRDLLERTLFDNSTLEAENDELKSELSSYKQLVEDAQRNLDLLERHQAWEVIDDPPKIMRLDEVTITHPILLSKKSERYSLILTDSAGVVHYFNHDGSYDGYAHDTHIDGKTGSCTN